MPFLKEIGLFRRNSLRRSLSAPNLNDLNVTDKSEDIIDGQNQFKKLINKLTVVDARTTTQKSTKNLQDFDLLEFDDRKLKSNKEVESNDADPTLSLLVNKELTLKIKKLEEKLKEKDLIIDDYFKRLAQIYVGFKVN